MQKKVYYLATCDTCKRIIAEVGIGKDFIYQDIKAEKITIEQLTEMAEMAGNYESLFSRIALKYKELGLKNRQLTEEDYQNYILAEYTFLKRPVFIIGEKIFIGNSPKTVKSLADLLKNSR